MKALFIFLFILFVSCSEKMRHGYTIPKCQSHMDSVCSVYPLRVFNGLVLDSTPYKLLFGKIDTATGVINWLPDSILKKFPGDSLMKGYSASEKIWAQLGNIDSKEYNITPNFIYNNKDTQPYPDTSKYSHWIVDGFTDDSMPFGVQWSKHPLKKKSTKSKKQNK